MNKRIMVALLALCLLTVSAAGALAADETLAMKVYEPESGAGVSVDSLVALPDGSLLLCGFVFEDAENPDVYGAYIAAFDADGSTLWARTPADLGDALLCRALGVLDDGRAAVLVRAGEDPTDWVIELIDASGATVETLQATDGNLGALTLLSKGYLSGGYTMQSATRREPMYAEDGFSLLDESLGTVWSQFYENLEGSLMTNVAEDEGGIVFGGYRQSYEGVNHSSQPTVVKVDWDGNLLWRYDGSRGSGFALINGVCALPDGGAVFTYEADPTTAIRTNALSRLTRLDNEGEIVYSEAYGTKEEPLTLSSMAPAGEGFAVIALDKDLAQQVLYIGEDGALVRSAAVEAPEGRELGVLRFARAEDGSLWAYGLSRPIPADDTDVPSTLTYRVVFAKVEGLW